MACMVRASCFTTARFVLHHQHAAATSQPLHAIMPIMLVKRGLHSEWWWQPPVTILSFIALHLRTHQHACIQLLPVYVTSRHTIARAVQHSHALIALSKFSKTIRAHIHPVPDMRHRCKHGNTPIRYSYTVRVISGLTFTATGCKQLHIDVPTQSALVEPATPAPTAAMPGCLA